MTLIPGEKAVLNQIRDLFLEGSVRTYRLNALTVRWPGLHYDAYNDGYEGLISKGLITRSADGQSFTITNAGMRALR